MTQHVVLTMPMTSEFQSLFEWQNTEPFRQALGAFRDRGRLSLQLWARRLGYRSPRSLGMVLDGRRRPSASLLAALCADLGLGASETEYLSLLYASETGARRGRSAPVAITRRIEALRKKNAVHRRPLASPSDLALLSDWLTFVVKQLSATPGFIAKTAWIHRRLRGVDSLAIQRTLSRLEKAGILREGRLIDSRSLFGPIDMPSEYIRRHHRQMLRQAERALEQPVERREIMSNTLRVHERDLPKIKQKLRAFADEFEAEFEKDSACEVAQLNLQFFLHTSQ